MTSLLTIGEENGANGLIVMQGLTTKPSPSYAVEVAYPHALAQSYEEERQVGTEAVEQL